MATVLPNVRTGREQAIGAFRHVKNHAVRVVIERPPIHMLDQRWAFVAGVKAVDVVRYEAYAHPWTGSPATDMPDLPLARHQEVPHRACQ